MHGDDFLVEEISDTGGIVEFMVFISRFRRRQS
jgi:hypothetical protein